MVVELSELCFWLLRVDFVTLRVLFAIGFTLSSSTFISGDSLFSDGLYDVVVESSIFLPLRVDFATLRGLFPTGFTLTSSTFISGDSLLSDFFRLVPLSVPSSTSLSVSFGFRRRFLDVISGALLKFEFL